jgi:uncharacterized Rmd1/YagE family protein
MMVLVASPLNGFVLSLISPALTGIAMSSYNSRGEGAYSEDMPLLPSAGVLASSTSTPRIGNSRGLAGGGGNGHQPLPSLEAAFGGPPDLFATASEMKQQQQQQHQGQGQQKAARPRTPLAEMGIRFPSPTRRQQKRETSNQHYQQPLPGGGAALPPHSQQQQQQQGTSKRVSKPSRPRKAISEFRKKTRILPIGWRGRIGVHVHVDEINIEKLGSKIKKNFASQVTEASKALEDESERGGRRGQGGFEVVDGGEGGEGGGPWDVIDYYDAIRVWQTSPPYLGQDLVIDWPLSEDEDTANEAPGREGSHQHQPSIDFESTRPEVFLFSFGAAVFWNFPSEQVEIGWLRDNVLEPFPEAVGDDHTDEEIEAAKDEMAFVYGTADKPFTIRRDVANLETRETGEKLAVSFALAKSSLLSVYEERVQKTIDRNSHIPEEMVRNGRLHMTRQDISREVGRMLLVKHGINLDTVRETE